VLLKTPLEGVTKSRVRSSSRQTAVVGLHQAPFTDPVALHFAAHGHNTAAHFVAGYAWLVAGDVTRAILQDCRADP
ncbi:MAG: hypothetical protein ABSA14_15825, partial [Acidimicrobiales bacterium]